MKMHEIIDIVESMDVDGTRIREIRTPRQLAAALQRHRFLRAFIDTDRNVIIAWDGNTLVHPDVRNATGDFGIPVQMDATSISIRPHGMPVPYIKQMYRELISAPVVKRVYNGVLPEIEVDDEYNDDLHRVDNLGWENDGDDDADGHWADEWVSY